MVLPEDFQLAHPVGPVLGGMVLYPITRGKEALRLFDEFSATCPDNVSTAGLLFQAHASRMFEDREVRVREQRASKLRQAIRNIDRGRRPRRNCTSRPRGRDRGRRAFLLDPQGVRHPAARGPGGGEGALPLSPL